MPATLLSPPIRKTAPVTRVRLVMISRRFWPLVGGAERVMANLATELHDRGAEVTLLTARWQPEWPAEIRYRGVPVVRLANPPQRVWGTWKYMRAVGRWLRRNRGRYDLVYVSMLKHDAYAALAALRRRVPVVLRAEGGGSTGDCAWQRKARCGRRIRRRCRRARAVVAPSTGIRQELVAAGYPPERVYEIPNGVPISRENNPAAKVAARTALAEANAAMKMPPGAPLAVYTGRLHSMKGLRYLVRAWKAIVARWPNARLWLIGEGPEREGLARLIDALDLSGSVVPAGTFDSVDEVLAAADLYVLPSLEEGLSVALLEAMAAGLPIVATDIPGNRQLIVPGTHGLLVPVDDADALAGAVARLIDDPDLAARMAVAARDRACMEYSLATVADRHVALFERLVSEYAT